MQCYEIAVSKASIFLQVIMSWPPFLLSQESRGAWYSPTAPARMATAQARQAATVADQGKRVRSLAHGPVSWSTMPPCRAGG